MIRYLGSGDVNSATISLYGDGQSKTVQVDLSAAPFNLIFNKAYPEIFDVTSAEGGTVPGVSMFKSVATLAFEEPLPEADEAARGPRTDVTLRFIYSGVTVEKTRKKKKK